MNVETIKKNMLNRWKKKLSTFSLQYDEEQNILNVYILGTVHVGLIDVNDIERMITTDTEEYEVSFYIHNRFKDSARELIFDILVGICVFIKDEEIDYKKISVYLYDPNLFFN